MFVLSMSVVLASLVVIGPCIIALSLLNRTTHTKAISARRQGALLMLGVLCTISGLIHILFF